MRLGKGSFGLRFLGSGRKGPESEGVQNFVIQIPAIRALKSSCSADLMK